MTGEAEDAGCPVAGVGAETQAPVNAVVLGMVVAEGAAEGAAVGREARSQRAGSPLVGENSRSGPRHYPRKNRPSGAIFGVIFILLLLVVISVGCNRVMIPVDDAREFYDCYRAMEQGITFNRLEAKEIYNALKKTFENWLKPFEESKGE